MRILLALAALPFLGCSLTFTYTKLNEPPHPLSPRSAENVQVSDGQPSGRDYVEIGIIEARKATFGASGEMSPRHIQLFREKAAELGCELIVFHSKTPVNAGVTSENRDRAACVVYR